MKIKLIIKKQRAGKYFNTVITHIKLLDEDGKYVKFTKHDNEILEHIQSLEIPISDDQLKLL